MQQNFLKTLGLWEIPHKQAWLGIIFIGTNILFWIFITRALSLRIVEPIQLSALVLLGFFLIIIYSLVILFVRGNLQYLLYLFLFIFLSVLFGFYDFNIIGIVFFLIFLLLAQLKANRTKKVLFEPRSYYIVKRFLPIFFIGVAIIFAFLYNSFILKFYVTNPHIPQGIYSVAFKPVDASLDLIFSEYERGMSFGEFQEALLGSLLVRVLPNQYQGQMQVDQISIPPVFGEEVVDASLEEFTLTWVNEVVRTMLAPYLNLLPVFFIVGLFFVFRFILWPTKWISILLLLIVVRVLMLYNIIILKEMQDIKRIPALE